MKSTIINIPALLLALLVLITSNGIAISEHICNTNRTHDYSLFTDATCEKEKSIESCCAKQEVQKKNCCENKQIFSKLSYDGFTAKQLEIKPLEKEINLKYFTSNFLHHNQQIFERYYSGIPPPENLFSIKYLLKPSPIKLQIFRC